MKEEKLKELGLAREPCVAICEPMTEAKRKEAIQNPEWEKQLKKK
jgi:hypothetical protein